MEVKEAGAQYFPQQKSVCPKGYKQTEVGVIPEDWDVQTLASVARVIGGGSFKSRDATSTGIRWLKIANVGVNVILWNEENFLPNNYANMFENFVLSEGDYVMALTRPILSGRLKIARIRKDDAPSLLNQRVGKIEKISGNDLAFVFFLLQKESIISALQQSMAGTDPPNLSTRGIYSVACAFPKSKAEQQAIAEALSDADALIESLQQLLTKKRQLKQGAMQQLLTGKKRLPGFIGEWEVKQLDELFSFSGGFTASRDQLSAEGYCYLHYGDIHTSNKNFINVKAEYQDIPKLDIPLKKVSPVSLLDNGDVVFVDASEDDEGASKHVVIINHEGIPYISGLHTIVAKSKTDDLDHLYRRYCFQTLAVKTQFRFFAVGTKVSGISKKNIAKIVFPVPILEEQAAIATILADMDAAISALEQKLAKARDIKQGMMQELLTGRIRLIK